MSVFRDEQKIVNMVDGEHMTLGKVYIVVNSYDGHSGGGGEQEWTRIVDDKGSIVGYDPDRFIPFVGDEETASATACALHLRSILKDLAKGMQGPLFDEARRRVGQGLQDVDSILGVIAEPARVAQIGIGRLNDRPPGVDQMDRRDFHDIAVAGKVVGYIVSTPETPPGTPGARRYDILLDVDKGVEGLHTEDWEVAFRSARTRVMEMAQAHGYENIDLWAKQRRRLPTMRDLVGALKAA